MRVVMNANEALLGFRRTSETCAPIKEALEYIKLKYKVLGESYKALKTENFAIQQKYKDLKTRVIAFNKLLQRDLTQLLDDTQQIGCISIQFSPIQHKKIVILENISLAGPSRVPISDPPLSPLEHTHSQDSEYIQQLLDLLEADSAPEAANRSLQIESIMQQLLDLSEVENVPAQQENQVSVTEGLSTETGGAALKEARVILTRLSAQVMEKHLGNVGVPDVKQRKRGRPKKERVRRSDRMRVRKTRSCL